MNTYSIDQLPELPLEALGLGATLEQAHTEPVLTFRPNKAAVPPVPSAPVAVAPRSQFSARKYLTQALYPKVVCYPFSDLFEATLQKVLEKRQEPLGENESDPTVIAVHEQFYKLTNLKFGGPFFCRVHYGPWSAVAFEEESCQSGVPNKWQFFVVSIPEVQLTWFGFWQDIPVHLYPSLHVIVGDLYLTGETTLCCPGHKWCATTNSCIPAIVKCQSPFPA